MTCRHVFALDLVDDPVLIAAYEARHAPGAVWPEVISSIRAAGIVALDIYRVDDRMVMVMDVDATFDAEAKARADAADPSVQAWEREMWAYQKALPRSLPGEKWKEMTRLFSLEDQLGSNT